MGISLPHDMGQMCLQQFADDTNGLQRNAKSIQVLAKPKCGPESPTDDGGAREILKLAKSNELKEMDV